ELQQHFRASPRAAPATHPQKPEGRTAKAQPAPAFDPDIFAQKLAYSDELKELGITQEDADRLGIGFHAKYKRIYFPIRNLDGSVSGFIGYANGELKMPPQWLTSNKVVAFPKKSA